MFQFLPSLRTYARTCIRARLMIVVCHRYHTEHLTLSICTIHSDKCYVIQVPYTYCNHRRALFLSNRTPEDCLLKISHPMTAPLTCTFDTLNRIIVFKYGTNEQFSRTSGYKICTCDVGERMSTGINIDGTLRKAAVVIETTCIILVHIITLHSQACVSYTLLIVVLRTYDIIMYAVYLIFMSTFRDVFGIAQSCLYYIICTLFYVCSTAH